VIVRLLNVLTVVALLAAGGSVVRCARQWSTPDSSSIVFPSESKIAQQSIGGTCGNSAQARETVSPLVAQAEAFASLLRPRPSPPPVPAVAVVQERPAPVEPLPAPVMESPKFRVVGTSCSEAHPERSMALVSELGQEGEAHWVREGTTVGHFVIHEIRDGIVICLSGERQCELAVEPQPSIAAFAIESGPRPASQPQNANGGAIVKDSPAAPLKRPSIAVGPRVGSARSAALN
jgi:hypothetical protein